jgi:hypothetical protein
MNGLGDPGRRHGLGAFTGAFRFLALDKSSGRSPHGHLRPGAGLRCKKNVCLSTSKARLGCVGWRTASELLTCMLDWR